MAQTKANILKVENLSVSYGLVKAIRQVSLEVNEGEIIVLLGANGAGKSTLINALLNIQPANEGTITFMGRDVTRQSTESIVASGISMVPEGRGILPLMTVMENLQLGAYHVKGDINKQLNQMFDRFTLLANRRTQLAGTLSGGEQQILAIARALMANPRLLIVDEPSLGLAPLMVKQVFDIIVELKKEGQAILLAEQNARKALQCADRGYVFEVGNIVLHDTAQELANDPGVRDAYLGGVN